MKRLALIALLLSAAGLAPCFAQAGPAWPEVRGPFSFADAIMNSGTLGKAGRIYRTRRNTLSFFTPKFEIETLNAGQEALRGVSEDGALLALALREGRLEDASLLLFASRLYAPSDTLEYLRGLAAFEVRDFEKAAESFALVPERSPFREGAELFLDAYSAAPSLPAEYKKRSPYVAAALSALVPGAGKMYAGDIHSGAATLLTVGALAGIFAESFVKFGARDWKTISLGSVLGLFYLGNIYGSFLSVSIMENAVSDAHKATLLFNIRIPLHSFAD